MRYSKKIFVIVVVIFFLGMAYLGYDISSRTTFPGSRPQLKERLLKDDNNGEAKDSVRGDSIKLDKEL